ncbi:hypothetical protein BJX70DRAFT_404316 [Aspergillus crustosus]
MRSGTDSEMLGSMYPTHLVTVLVVAHLTLPLGGDCVRAGLDGDQDALEHLFWDPQTRKIMIAGWSASELTTDDTKWDDNMWAIWSLVRGPVYPCRGHEPRKDQWIW